MGTVGHGGGQGGSHSPPPAPAGPCARQPAPAREEGPGGCPSRCLAKGTIILQSCQGGRCLLQEALPRALCLGQARPGQTPPGGAPGTPGSPRLRRRAGDTEVDTHTDAHGAPSIHCAGRSWPRAALSPEAGPGSALCTGRSDCSHQGALLASSHGALAWLRQAISGFWFSSWELWRPLGGGAMETPGGRGSGNRDLQMCSRLLGLQPRLGGRPSWGL